MAGLWLGSQEAGDANDVRKGRQLTQRDSDDVGVFLERPGGDGAMLVDDDDEVLVVSVVAWVMAREGEARVPRRRPRRCLCFFSFGLRLRFWGRADVFWWTTGVPNKAKQAGSTGAPATLGVEGP